MIKLLMKIMRELAINKTLSLAALLLIPMISVAHAERKNVTPYGDYCKDYSVYGICRDALLPDEALSALNKYYRGKGCKVLIVHHRGRFIMAEIYRNRRQVDKVIFDKNTGRLRSVY